MAGRGRVVIKRGNAMTALWLMLCALVPSGAAAGLPLQLAPRMVVNPPALFLSPAVSRWLQNHSHINVGIWGPSQPPVTLWMERGQLAGIDADYLAVIESALNVHFNLLYFATREQAIAALNRGDIAMLAVWRPELESSVRVAASASWLQDSAVIVSASAAQDRQRDIDMGLLAMMRGQDPNPDPDGPSPQAFQDYYHAIQSISSGQAQAVVLNHITARYLTRDGQAENVWLIPERELGTINFSFGVNRDAPHLLTAIDEVLRRLSLVSRLRIIHGWGVDSDEDQTAHRLNLTPTERRWLQQHQPITVILDARRAPFSFINPQGEPDGLAVRLLELLSDQFGLLLEYQIASDDEALEQLKRGYPRAIFSHALSVPGEGEAARATLRSGAPWLITPAVLMMARDYEKPLSLRDLDGEKIAIEQDNPLLPWLETWYPLLQLVPVPSLSVAMGQLRARQVRGAIASQFAARYYLQRAGEGGLYQALSLPVKPLNVGFAFPQGEAEARSIMDKALQQVTPQRLLTLAGAWREAPAATPSPILPLPSSEAVFATLAGIVLLVALFALWIKQLRHRVRAFAERLQTTQALMAQLEAAKSENEQTLRAHNAFMKSMGHEVRTPLNAVIGLLELELAALRRRGGGNGNIQTAWESACALLSRVEDVFDIFRAEARDDQSSMRTVDMPSLLHGIVALYQQQAEEKGSQIQMDNALSSPLFECDPLLLIRVVSSLLRNALRHTGRGDITVAVYQGQRLEDGRLPLVIEVGDSGEGIAAPERVLNGAEEQGHPLAQTGFSLAVCRRMARGADGDLTLESTVGKGTTVCLHLSLHPARAAQPQPASDGACVLIVEDYPPARWLLRQQLNELQREVLIASNGQEGLTLWQQRRQEIGLVITDCTMPVMDGFTMTRQIRDQERAQRLAPVPILGLTAMSRYDAARSCFAAGMNECLTKPIAPDTLERCLARYPGPGGDTAPVDFT
jgi:two-component system sensor histidine kinase EvgS